MCRGDACRRLHNYKGEGGHEAAFVCIMVMLPVPSCITTMVLFFTLQDPVLMQACGRRLQQFKDESIAGDMKWDPRRGAKRSETGGGFGFGVLPGIRRAATSATLPVGQRRVLGVERRGLSKRCPFLTFEHAPCCFFAWKWMNRKTLLTMEREWCVCVCDRSARSGLDALKR